ncbi:hypothetical protein PIB30_074259 [Stylosanthes scabra]|uniref:Uncharacterized protein n=1 Tax=Stylosanthes scabra TaxID=79078 RepID=A0ABU6SPR2_9FABA|nr:hypothetical protein [Stylosanthes scabra]
MGMDADGIWFRSVSPVVFQMQPVNTLEELKCVILRNMGAAGAMSVRRVAYRLLNLFPPNQFKFKIFWVDSDAHIRAMFELHRRYGSREVMELLTETETVNVDAAGPSSSSREFVPESQARQGFLLPAPSPIPDLSSVDSHFYTLNLDDMTEVQREGFGGGGEDYDLDGGSKITNQGAGMCHSSLSLYNPYGSCGLTSGLRQVDPQICRVRVFWNVPLEPYLIKNPEIRISGPADPRYMGDLNLCLISGSEIH